MKFDYLQEYPDRHPLRSFESISPTEVTKASQEFVQNNKDIWEKWNSTGDHQKIHVEGLTYDVTPEQKFALPWAMPIHVPHFYWDIMTGVVDQIRQIMRARPIDQVTAQIQRECQPILAKAGLPANTFKSESISAWARQIATRNYFPTYCDFFVAPVEFTKEGVKPVYLSSSDNNWEQVYQDVMKGKYHLWPTIVEIQGNYPGYAGFTLELLKQGVIKKDFAQHLEVVKNYLYGADGKTIITNSSIKKHRVPFEDLKLIKDHTKILDLLDLRDIPQAHQDEKLNDKRLLATCTPTDFVEAAVDMDSKDFQKLALVANDLSRWHVFTPAWGVVYFTKANLDQVQNQLDPRLGLTVPTFTADNSSELAKWQNWPAFVEKETNTESGKGVEIVRRQPEITSTQVAQPYYTFARFVPTETTLPIHKEGHILEMRMGLYPGKVNISSSRIGPSSYPEDAQKEYSNAGYTLKAVRELVAQGTALEEAIRQINSGLTNVFTDESK